MKFLTIITVLHPALNGVLASSVSTAQSSTEPSAESNFFLLTRGCTCKRDTANGTLLTSPLPTKYSAPNTTISSTFFTADLGAYIPANWTLEARALTISQSSRHAYIAAAGGNVSAIYRFSYDPQTGALDISTKTKIVDRVESHFAGLALDEDESWLYFNDGYVQGIATPASSLHRVSLEPAAINVPPVVELLVQTEHMTCRNTAEACPPLIQIDKLAIDSVGGYIFWSSEGYADGHGASVYRARLSPPAGQTWKDRTDIELIHSGMKYAGGLKFFRGNLYFVDFALEDFFRPGEGGYWATNQVWKWSGKGKAELFASFTAKEYVGWLSIDEEREEIWLATSAYETKLWKAPLNGQGQFVEFFLRDPYVNERLPKNDVPTPDGSCGSTKGGYTCAKGPFDRRCSSSRFCGTTDGYWTDGYSKTRWNYGMCIVALCIGRSENAEDYTCIKRK
ncbi:hypothetical protein K505DRAFT_331234 [Melanomma pulvis-pyrius CBS 109.77]|uniref:Uncharacterized protein n=1 Tax=Melanomma pulvis-pyrius CBS 109.77 TaxID=1314802 RepID=A0A6A6XX08_9PLEO|nr:hypothetical protein K505DRAFT_331234 [Melanomma pulvis-pyrius CBS 109.77]